MMRWHPRPMGETRPHKIKSRQASFLAQVAPNGNNERGSDWLTASSVAHQHVTVSFSIANQGAVRKPKLIRRPLRLSDHCHVTAFVNHVCDQGLPSQTTLQCHLITLGNGVSE